MDLKKDFREHRAFFKHAAKLRRIDREPMLHTKELRRSLKEIAVLAKTAQSDELIERASNILLDFAKRHEYAQKLHDEVEEQRWTELQAFRLVNPKVYEMFFGS